MSSDGSVYVKKGQKEIIYYGKYQYNGSLGCGISIAWNIYTKSPKSYKAVFKSPEDYEEDFFSFSQDGFGDTSVTVDLDSELIEFNWFTFYSAMESQSIENVKQWLAKFQPYSNPKITEDVLLQAQTYKNILSNELFEDVEFALPFARLPLFKELAYSWVEENPPIINMPPKKKTPSDVKSPSKKIVTKLNVAEMVTNCVNNHPEGVSLIEIAKSTKLSFQTVRKWVLENPEIVIYSGTGIKKVFSLKHGGNGC